MRSGPRPAQSEEGTGRASSRFQNARSSVMRPSSSKCIASMTSSSTRRPAMVSSSTKGTAASSPVVVRIGPVRRGVGRLLSNPVQPASVLLRL